MGGDFKEVLAGKANINSVILTHAQSLRKLTPDPIPVKSKEVRMRSHY